MVVAKAEKVAAAIGTESLPIGRRHFDPTVRIRILTTGLRNELSVSGECCSEEDDQPQLLLSLVVESAELIVVSELNFDLESSSPSFRRAKRHTSFVGLDHFLLLKYNVILK